MRKRMVDGVEIPFTPAQEAARDAEEADWVLQKARIDIEDTFQASLETARQSLSDAELNLYRGLRNDIETNGRNPGAATPRLNKFVTGRGIIRAQAILEIKAVIDPIEEAEALALGVRDEAIASL